MAKRFTDTDKWKREWFTDLPLKAKMVWIYVLDTCDHCGVWHVNFKLMSFQLGESITEAEFESWFGDKVRKIEADKYFIPSYLEFQYGELNPDNNAHKAAIKLLEKLGSNEDLIRPSRGAQDKDKDKDKDQEEDKEPKLKSAKPSFDFEPLYAKYPRKDGKTRGMKLCNAQIKTQADYDDLSQAINVYRHQLARDGTEKKFIKQFATFMGCWRDYVADASGVFPSVNDYQRDPGSICGIKEW